ncbi:MAG: tRNA (N(6)-L-threonylcarbamoyladenosine(37)-C(2))-methylthiotransferase MtaB [Deltaproteobacteria bacterium]
MKTVAVYTLGCKVNQVESEAIIEDFLNRGYQLVHSDEPADIYIVNTCTVTHVSDRKSRAVIRRAVRRQPDALVVVTGCMAQMSQDPQELPAGISLLVSNRDKERLGEIVESWLEGGSRRADMSLPKAEEKLKPVLYSNIHERTRAFVKIQDGCQSYCSYCIVPFVRGPVRSKLPNDVIKEVRQLVELGYQEIVFTGIHCGLYGMDVEGWDLSRLLRSVLDKVPGSYRIRTGSIEPLEVTPDLITLLAESNRVCNHLHIPLQSGSDRILKLMRRRYDRDYYRSLLTNIAEKIPDIGMAADIMVGFPSEDEEDFAQTFELLSGLPLLDLHVFKYSPRPGTKAYELGDNVAAAVKQQRSERLLALAADKHRNFCRRFIGRELEVLTERKARDNYYLGFTDNYMEVGFSDAIDHRGQTVKVSLKEFFGDRLQGDVL